MGYQHIIVAVDNDTESRQVCEKVVNIGSASGTRITLVHIIQPAAPLVTPGITGSVPAVPSYSEEQLQEMIASAEQELESRATSLAEAFKPDDPPLIQCRVIQGADIRTALHDIAREEGADLLVAGSHGRHGFALFFAGSTASDILKDSPCDVLAVRIQQ